MDKSNMTRADSMRYNAWVDYRKSKGLSITDEEFLNRNKHKSKYGPQDKYNENEEMRHKRYCMRNGWIPYQGYLNATKNWYDKRNISRRKYETPRERTERILKEKGLAPGGVNA